MGDKDGVFTSRVGRGWNWTVFLPRVSDRVWDVHVVCRNPWFPSSFFHPSREEETGEKPEITRTNESLSVRGPSPSPTPYRPRRRTGPFRSWVPRHDSKISGLGPSRETGERTTLVPSGGPDRSLGQSSPSPTCVSVGIFETVFVPRVTFPTPLPSRPGGGQ